LHNLTGFVSFASMGILIVVGVIAFIIWASSNSTHDHHVHPPAKSSYDPTETIDDIGDIGQWPVKVPTAEYVPKKRMWNTNGILSTIPDTTMCVAQYDTTSGVYISREDALRWYIDPLIAGNPISPAEQKVADALNEFPVEWFREVSFYGMPLPSGKHGRVDFYIPALALVIEYDGENWHYTPEQLARDQMKNEFCTRWGLTMIRLNKKHYYHMDYQISGIMNRYGIRRR